MFGNDFSEEALENFEAILPLTRERIEFSNADQIRLEIERLYDMGKSNIFGAAMNLSVVEEEVDMFSTIQNAYNNFMQEYEDFITNNNN